MNKSEYRGGRYDCDFFAFDGVMSRLNRERFGEGSKPENKDSKRVVYNVRELSQEELYLASGCVKSDWAKITYNQVGSELTKPPLIVDLSPANKWAFQVQE